MKIFALILLFLSLRSFAQESTRTTVPEASAGTVVSTLPVSVGEEGLSFEKRFFTLSLFNNFASDLDVDGSTDTSSGATVFKLPMEAQSAVGVGADYYIPWLDELGWYVGGRYEGRRQIKSVSFDTLGSISEADLGGATPTLSLIILRGGMTTYLHPRIGIFAGPNISFPFFKQNGAGLQFSANGNSTELTFGPRIGYNAGIHAIVSQRFLVEFSYNSTVIGQEYEFLSDTGGPSVIVQTTGKIEGVLLSLRYMI